MLLKQNRYDSSLKSARNKVALMTGVLDALVSMEDHNTLVFKPMDSLQRNHEFKENPRLEDLIQILQ